MEALNLQQMGKRISDRRRQAGLTQAQLAEQMDVSIQMISNLERGLKAIRIENLLHISRILGVSTDYLLTGQQTPDDLTALAGRIARLREDHRRILENLVTLCLQEEELCP